MPIIETATLVASSGIFSGLVTYFLRRKNANRTVRVSEFDVITREWGELHAALMQRLDDLELVLVAERKEHRETRHLLALAVRHIRDVVTWAAGDRKAPIPEPPAELMGADL